MIGHLHHAVDEVGVAVGIGAVGMPSTIFVADRMWPFCRTPRLICAQYSVGDCDMQGIDQLKRSGLWYIWLNRARSVMGWQL